MDNTLQTGLQESLRIQLTELNNRSRWYSSQLWQIPFAFISLVGLLIGNIATKFPDLLHFTFLTVGLFGILVLIHMNGIMNGERRAVENLKKIEAALQIPQTVEYKPTYVRPLYLLVWLSTVTSIITGAYSIYY
ncbi:hypothetical protein A9Q78_01120 [Methylophaga sp. 41_12_T18]|nr:hypothetical protein A9Q78_01120 [Methylophaga sp. 41_12_T18]